MEITTKGEPKEIAALVLGVQERQGIALRMDPDVLFRAIHDKAGEAQ